MGLPLSGVRILDLTTIISGPYGTMILSDLGAEIIKVERPGTGDGGRGTPSYIFEGEGAYFIAHNRNKKSIVLNLDSARLRRDRPLQRQAGIRPHHPGARRHHELHR